MKIVIRNEQGIKDCYVQFRDIEYIGERFHSQFFLNYAVRGHKKGINSDDFVNVGNRGIAKLFDSYPYIVDFSEVVKYDSVFISRMIVLTHSFLPDEKTKMDEEHKIGDYIDIINYKKGTLTYPIPIFFDDQVLFDNGEVVFGSTTLPSYYMLRTANKEIDLSSYLAENVTSLYGCVDPDREVVSCETMKSGTDLLVHFKTKKKKKEKKKNN